MSNDLQVVLDNQQLWFCHDPMGQEALDQVKVKLDEAVKTIPRWMIVGKDKYPEPHFKVLAACCGDFILTYYVNGIWTGLPTMYQNRVSRYLDYLNMP